MIIFVCFGFAVIFTILWGMIEKAKNSETKVALTDKDYKFLYIMTLNLTLLVMAQLVAIKNIEIKHQEDKQHVQTTN